MGDETEHRRTHNVCTSLDVVKDLSRTGDEVVVIHLVDEKRARSFSPGPRHPEEGYTVTQRFQSKEPLSKQILSLEAEFSPSFLVLNTDLIDEYKSGAAISGSVTDKVLVSAKSNVVLTGQVDYNVDVRMQRRQAISRKSRADNEESKRMWDKLKQYTLKPREDLTTPSSRPPSRQMLKLYKY